MQRRHHRHKIMLVGGKATASATIAMTASGERVAMAEVGLGRMCRCDGDGCTKNENEARQFLTPEGKMCRYSILLSIQTRLIF